mmetsp:Transcript_12011/g.16299  ORF Transcript_12011/g.16299 Transcript_12011/m.16299 type:complete len:227 (-) Transcript_12011:43-723(-)
MRRDVARTSDNVLVASHGRDFARLLGLHSANIGDYSADTVMSTETGTGDRVPDFENALQAALDSDIELITIDYKPGPPRGEEGFSADVVQAIQRVNCGPRCQAWSKSDSQVRETIQLSPRMRTGYVVLNQTEGARRQGMDIVGRLPTSEVAAAYYGMVDEDFVRAVHKLRQQVFAWTVNDVVALKKVLEAAVDGIVTNHPRTVQNIINSLKLQCITLEHEALKLKV